MHERWPVYNKLETFDAIVRDPAVSGIFTIRPRSGPVLRSGPEVIS